MQFAAEERVSGPIPANKKATVKSGIVTGKVTFTPFRPGPEREGDEDNPETKTIAEKMFATHKVEILKLDSKKKVGEVTINKDGVYKADLVPGKYYLQITPARFGKRPIEVEVISGKTTRVDISVDTGFQ
jgi:hypothetical protein